MSKKIVKKIINEVCKEKDIEKIDLSYDWISILKKDNIEIKMVNYKLDINSSISEKIANDKYSTYEVLQFHKIPIIEHKVLFNENIMPEYSYVNDNFNILKNNKKVVIKVNQSSQGKDVFLCDKEEEKIKIVKDSFTKGKESVCVCPYIEIEAEYRAFYVCGEIEYIYRKQKPFIIGNGISSVGELISKNLKYLVDIPKEINLSYIPKKQEKIIVGWKHNLSQGAIPQIIDEHDKYYKEVKEIAKKTAEVIGLNLTTIDIIVTKEKKVQVMEVNSNFGIAKFCEFVPEGYTIMKKIYKKVVDKIFEK